MTKKIKYMTLEDQGKSLREYSRSLTPVERFEYLYQLICQAYDVEHAKKLSDSDTIHFIEKKDSETLEEFLRRRNKEKRAKTQ